MKPAEIRDLSDEEVVQKEKDMEEEYFNLRFQFFTGQLDNTARMRLIRRDVARLKTLRRERGL